MQKPTTSRPESRRKTPAYAGGAAHFPANNERQLLARIAQIEAAHHELLNAAKRLADRSFFLPTDCADAATRLDMVAMRVAMANSERVVS